MNPLKFIVPAVIIWVVGLLFGHIEKKNEKELIDSIKNDRVAVHLPKAYLIVGIIGIAFSAGILLLYAFAPHLFTPGSSWFFYAVMSAYGVVCFCIVLSTVTWRITIDKREDHFMYRTFLGRKYTVKYGDCTSFRDTNQILILRTKSKTFYIDSHAANIEVFLGQLTKNGVKEVHLDPAS